MTTPEDGNYCHCVGLVIIWQYLDNSDYWIAIPVADFAAHTAKLHSNRDLGFEEEYGVRKG